MERGDGEASSGDGADPRGPSIESSSLDSPLGDTMERMDAPATARDREALENFGARASPEELAKSGYLPDWARDLALDAEANQEYERDLNRKRAALHKSVQAGGRDWGEDAEFGFAEFNVLELAADHDVPVEGVVETLASSGVATSKLREALREPVKNFANDAQLRELIAFLLAVDKIELADERLDESVADLAEETVLTPAQVLALCQDLGYPMLTEDARIKKADWDLVEGRIEEAAQATFRASPEP